MSDLFSRLRAEGCTCRGHLHKPIPGNVYCGADGCDCTLNHDARVRLRFEPRSEER